MTDISSWIAHFEEAWRNTVGSIISYLPILAGVLILMLLGWVVARLARAGVRKLGNVINRISDSLLAGTALSRFRLTTRSLQIIGNATALISML